MTCDTDVRFGQTNPMEEDTDGDTLSNMSEVDGIAFPFDKDVPFRITNPLEQDTDGDDRRDDTEFNEPWIVDIDGQRVYEVFSDPTQADQDGDKVLDSVESARGADPTKFDTDEDGRSDGIELDSADILRPNHVVTVVYDSFFLSQTISGLGVGEFTLGFARPGASGALESQTIVSSTDVIAEWPPCSGRPNEIQVCRSRGHLKLPASSVARLRSPGSEPFSLALTDVFVLEGSIEAGEIVNGEAILSRRQFGGFADERSVFVFAANEKGITPFKLEIPVLTEASLIVSGYIRVE